MIKNKEQWTRFGKIAFLIGVMAIIFFQGKKELQNISLKEALKIVNQISIIHVVIIIIVALISVGTMFFYDYFFIRSQHLKVKKTKIFGVSWIANSFNGIFGFGGLVGAGIRGMLYREYTKNSGDLAKGIAWMAPAAAMGLSFFSFLALVGIFPIKEMLAEKSWLVLVLLGTSLLTPIYIGLSRYRKSTYFSPLITIQYSIVSIIEWLGAGVVLYLSFVFVDIKLTFLQVFGIFVVAAVTGFISMVPGGFGSFDLVVLLSGEVYGINSEMLLTALLLYRFAYYLVPFVIGLILSAVEVTSSVMKKSEDNYMITSIVEISGVLWALQRRVFNKLGNWSLSLLAFITGYFLIVVPVADIITIHGLGKSKLSLLTLDSYNLALFVCGITLWYFMKEQYYRTKRSLHILTVTLIISTILLLFQSENIIIGLMAAAHLIVLVLLRKQFNRQSLPFTSASIRWLVYLCGICFILFVVLVRESLLFVDYNKPLYGVFSIGFSGCLLAFLYVLLSIIIYEKSHQIVIGEAYSDEKLTGFLQKYGGHSLSHLGFLGDKRMFFSDDRKAMLQFAVTGKNIIVLGDPQGDKKSFENVLIKLNEATDYFGYRCIFYQISEELLPLYHDLGFLFFKLGEEAVVDLDSFTISGKKKAGLRSTFNRFEKNGYTFSVNDLPLSDGFLQEMKYVSDEWLGKKREKQFSLGYFDKDYLARTPIAVLRDKEGTMIAFMNIMPTYQEGVVSVDLMRYLPDAPGGATDVMFIHLFQWAKEKGYTKFNIGMAPLSNVGCTKHSFLRERIAEAVFNNIRYMYKFSGLRNFKNKYHPEWSGKYLAYRKNYSLASIMLQITKLISKGGKSFGRRDSLKEDTDSEIVKKKIRNAM
ncbi:bifunctional lysylphosphatidylglycerol flippase/synthetase MprF [Virgibacillus dakarensis]|uniref:bifunctional lysylphosphatidylglycerol flippase/synthetase MprF n=1 Tax=Virgibacillus dakarensis TaxID=1917889 RepID=UPI00135658F6|nr:bifunctional lysylphosphatidylglycerol flippase/synthetase MprF [Virgibacillus dakarensis]